jgi:hypothetical protein
LRVSSDTLSNKLLKAMKLTTLLLTAVIAVPVVGFADSLKDTASNAWDTTKDAASKTGQTIENGTVKAGRVIEHGVQKTGDFVARTVVPTPSVTLRDGGLSKPDSIPAGSDLIVRNRSDMGERFTIRGNGIDDHVFVPAKQSRKMNLDLQPGNYSISSADSGMSRLHVR